VWRTFAEDLVALSEEGAVATLTKGYSDLSGYHFSLTTTGVELTKGKHYWEVELLSDPQLDSVLIGISRPNLDPTGDWSSDTCTDSWFIGAYFGHLYGNGKYADDGEGEYEQGDRVGVLLDLDNGSLRFFKNGAQHGPGYAAGSVTGPVVAAVQLKCAECSVRLLPNAQQPE
jgi:hypothetical protein